MTNSADVTPASAQKFRNAVRLALATGAAGAAAGHAGDAMAQAAPAATTGGGGELEEIVVTGSRIRRAIDEATASPIAVIGQDQIVASGLQNTGELLAQLPGVAGQAMTPAVNNGGGFGESNVELRGLNAKRTLVLLDGRRVGIVGDRGIGTQGDAVDINQIPVNIIDHVDVLKEGAGATYGSDAIAGVVNFITRRTTDGLEINAEAGQTTHNDGAHEGVSLLWGGSTDKLEFMISGSYTRQKEVSAGDRNFSKNALYLYSGSTGRHVSVAGSSRVPNGKVYLSTLPALKAQFKCKYLTRTPGTDGTAIADYQCLHGTYNYQPFNLALTPQERGSLFTNTSYKINDELTAYAEVLINKTHSGFQFAPLPFDAQADNIIISAQNEYNPFGVDFGGLVTNNANYRTRFVTLGVRHSDTDSYSNIITGGLRGNLPFKDWQWDAHLGYNRVDQNQTVDGYVYFPGLQQEVGPSFQDATGWHCGTAGSPIAGCTPINFFDLNSPQTISQLQALGTPWHSVHNYTFKTAAIDLNGTVVTLPAGDLKGAIGFDYLSQSTSYVADYIVQSIAPLYINCLISEEACTGNTYGGYNSREYYAEAFAPILKDLPGVKTLNIDLGVRYSDYSLFGSTTKSQAKLEYKPVSSLLIRATFAQVFRVPTLNDLYGAPLANNPNFSDPCYGYKGGGSAGLQLACANVPTDGSYSYGGTAQITTQITSNPNLKPESGTVWTYGFVAQIPYVDNLSLTVNLWRYDINNLITQLDPNYTSSECVSTASPFFCSLIHRIPSGGNQGNIEVIQQPTVNLGELKTQGVDYDIAYHQENTRLGSFKYDLSATYTDNYLNIPIAGGPEQELAGGYTRQFGNYAKWRGIAQMGWALGGFNGLLQLQYIDKLVVHNPAVQSAALLGKPQADLKIPRILYLNATLGYTYKPTRTKVQFGMQNITNREAPIFYQNNVLNSDTDVSTYDTVGRRLFVSLQQKF
jgi:iron complex outermembrane recepter protein